VAPKANSRWPLIAVAVLAAIGLCVGGWYAIARAKQGSSQPPGEHAADGGKPGQHGITVEVTHPRPGGIVRKSEQPGTVEPFDFEDVYAKVSGYLVEQPVDIGSHVTRNQLLARVAVPEYEAQFKRDEAHVKAAKAKVQQMVAHIAAAEAEARAAAAYVKLATVTVKAKTAYREYREKQLNRIKELVSKSAVDERLRDEQEDYYLSAFESENAAKEQVSTSMEKELAAKAKIQQAEADKDAAEADVKVAEAELQKSAELLKYTEIRAPYDGVITQRSYSPGQAGTFGAFVRSADQNGALPLLRVESIAVMRVVTQVPDRDVPYVAHNTKAIVRIDALPGRVFDKNGDKPLLVSRWAAAEDPITRTMRTEVDIQNVIDAAHPNGLLSHGMYGRVTLILTQGTPDAIRVPSSALVGKADDGHGTVRVVRDGKVHIVKVRYASDDGIETEITEGLTTKDQVIVRASGPVENGTPVTVNVVEGSSNSTEH
jgi:RND family efflux transporter MFP subunit